MGADDVVKYRSDPEWGKRVRELTGGRIGFLSEDDPDIEYFLLKCTGGTTRFVTVGDRTDLQNLVRAVTSTGLTPVIDDVFEFGQARMAFGRLRDGKHIGKLVIRIS